MRTFLSFTVVLISLGIRIEAQEWDVFVGCYDTFRKGSRLYYQNGERKADDVINLEKAIPVLDTATVICKGQHLESTAWHTLANALYYTGNWNRAINAYTKLSTMYPHPAIAEMLLVLRACQRDEKLEFLRLGNVYELHKDLRTALSFYSKASSSNCAPLARHSREEADRVRDMLSGLQQRVRPRADSLLRYRLKGCLMFFPMINYKKNC